ncbi:hypothetical protein RB195_010741 [Necator americanus]|uniref:Uncharacterized protein n=1 Tax=Necator americanus TaxID=51031 RepID=A0ABR1D026_NECAM
MLRCPVGRRMAIPMNTPPKLIRSILNMEEVNEIRELQSTFIGQDRSPYSEIGSAAPFGSGLNWWGLPTAVKPCNFPVRYSRQRFLQPHGIRQTCDA